MKWFFLAICRSNVLPEHKAAPRANKFESGNAGYCLPPLFAVVDSF
jgi:hypothetical protein